MKRKHLALVSSALLGAASAGTLGMVGNFFYNLALDTKTPKKFITNAIRESQIGTEKIIHDSLNWLLNKSNFIDEYITSHDKLKLHAFKILNKSNSNKWAILVHGYTGSCTDMGEYAIKFYDMGYNILIPDLRGHGVSDGKYIGMGWPDRLDMLKWIDLIMSISQESQIVLYGISMGGATVSMTSGEKLPKNVKAIISDCAYSCVWKQFSHQLKVLYSLPTFPIINLSSLVTKLKAGYNFKQASTLKQVSKSVTPMLFIHGDMDDFVPYSMMEELFNAAKCEKEKLSINGAGHARCASTDPETYWSSIFNFIDKYIA